MYSSLKLVKVLAYGWEYFPNGLDKGFTISKGYFSIDTDTGIFQIVEDGKTKRPGVLLQNVIVQDLTTDMVERSYTSLANLQNDLFILKNPLSGYFNITGVQTVTGSAVDNTDPYNPVINVTGVGIDPVARLGELKLKFKGYRYLGPTAVLNTGTDIEVGDYVFGIGSNPDEYWNLARCIDLSDSQPQNRANYEPLEFGEVSQINI